MLEAYLNAIEHDFTVLNHVFGQSGDLLPTYQVAEADGRFLCTLSWQQQQVAAGFEAPTDVDPTLRELHRKRTLRRLVKQCHYDALKAATGYHPAWGSATGVRPTRLLVEGLEAGLSIAQARQRVIDAFDISPEKADLLVDTWQTQQQLRPAALDEMNVYIGIPFCTTRCSYCTFSSGTLGDGRLVAPYLNALEKEMRIGADLLRDSGKKLRALYIGGGTPTSLDKHQLDRLLCLTEELFPHPIEITVEAGRPDTINRAKLQVIQSHGVNRISINPQTMVDRTLRLIGRGHTAAQTEEAYALAREVGIPHINMDVIAALPGETPDDFAVTMEAALRLHPESLTVHALALKRSSAMWLRGAALPDEATATDMVRMGHATARQLGMQPYYLYRQKSMAGGQENVGYALSGHACQYNVDTMEESAHVLAFGASAISKRVYANEGKIDRAPNIANIEQYIARVAELAERKRALFLTQA